MNVPLVGWSIAYKLTPIRFDNEIGVEIPTDGCLYVGIMGRGRANLMSKPNPHG